MLNVELLPKKLLDVCDFEKTETGCILYSTYSKPELKNSILIKVVLDSFEIPNNFRIPAKSLELFRKLDNAELSVTDSSFIVKNNKSRFTSKLLDFESVSYKNDIDFENEQVMNVEKMLKACEYVSKNDKKPVLKGVFLDSNGSIYATDSFSVYKYGTGINNGDVKGISIPVDFIRLVSDLFGNDDVKISFNETKVKATKGNITIESVLWSGQYPPLDKIFLQCLNNSNKAVEINKNDFNEVIKYINYVEYSTDKHSVVKLENNKITLLGDNQLTSELDFDIDYIMTVDAERFEVGLKTIDEEKINSYCLAQNGQGKMILFDSNNTDEKVLILGIYQA